MKAKNVKKRLTNRVRDFQSMIKAGSREYKVQLRMDTGGYTRPGSNNK